MKNLLKLSDLTGADIEALIARALVLKAERKAGKGPIPGGSLTGKTLALIFEKASTRTRVSFEAGMSQLGGGAVFLSPADSQIGRGEPVKDTARVISGYADGVVIRTFGHDLIEEFARHATIPVINGLTDTHHPCQVLADIMTTVEMKGGEMKGGERKGGGKKVGLKGLKALKVAWIGDGNNMANSWVEAAALLGFKLAIACPEGYCPDAGVLKEAKAAGADIECCVSVKEAASGADVLNTDVWASMGHEEERAARKKAFEGFQINDEVLTLAKDDAIVMHCLPAHRGEEITDEVIEGASSAVWDQAENRLHVQKAVLLKLLG